MNLNDFRSVWIDLPIQLIGQININWCFFYILNANSIFKWTFQTVDEGVTNVYNDTKKKMVAIICKFSFNSGYWAGPGSSWI
jgi:hypothetical protein